MTKTNLALVLLVAAVPGALLLFVLVMAFLSYSENMSGALMGVAGLTLLLSGGAAALPVVAVMTGPRTPKAEPEAEAVAEAGGEAPQSEEYIVDEAQSTEVQAFEPGELEEEEEPASGEMDVADTDQDIFEVEDEEEFEEPPPKRKKR